MKQVIADIQYLVEYVEKRTEWCVAEFKNKNDAINHLKLRCKQEPHKSWQITKKVCSLHKDANLH